jgi:excisionase family DNA binding protein
MRCVPDSTARIKYIDYHHASTVISRARGLAVDHPREEGGDDMADRLVDVKDLAERYGPPPSWWYAKAEAGEIPSFKLGKYRRFKIADVEDWLERHREGPPAKRG